MQSVGLTITVVVDERTVLQRVIVALVHTCKTLYWTFASSLAQMFWIEAKLNFDQNSRILLLNPTTSWHECSDGDRVAPEHFLPISVLLFCSYCSVCLEFPFSFLLISPFPTLRGLPAVHDPSSAGSLTLWNHYWVWNCGKPSVRWQIGPGQSSYGHLNHENEHKVRAHVVQTIRGQLWGSELRITFSVLGHSESRSSRVWHDKESYH